MLKTETSVEKVEPSMEVQSVPTLCSWGRGRSNITTIIIFITFILFLFLRMLSQVSETSLNFMKEEKKKEVEEEEEEEEKEKEKKEEATTPTGTQTCWPTSPFTVLLPLIHMFMFCLPSLASPFNPHYRGLSNIQLTPANIQNALFSIPQV